MIQGMISLGKAPGTLKKNVILLFFDGGFYKCQLDSRWLVVFNSSTSLLIALLLVLSITKKEY